MTPEQAQELRAARNSYRSAVAAASGYVSGQRIYAVRTAKRELERLLWNHRDELVEAVSEPI